MGEPEAIHPSALNSPDPPVGFGGRIRDVRDRDLGWLGAVDLPPRFRPYRITHGAVYGVARDDLDRETILRVRRPGAD